MRDDLRTAIQSEAREAIERLGPMRIIVWGAGELGRWLMLELAGKGVSFVDTNPTKIGTRIAERDVRSPQELAELEFDEVWVSVLSDSAGICEQLKDREIPFRLVFPGGKRLQIQDELPRTLRFLDAHDFAGREILEVGSGGQLYLALTLAHLGAKSVRVTDVGPLGNPLRDRREEWTAYLAHLERIRPEGHTPEDLFSRLEFEPDPIDAARLPFADESFDGIINTGVMEHVDKPASAIDEFARLLRPEGLSLCLAIGIHDHRANDPQAEFTPWSFLTVDGATWERLGKSAYHQNRWRAVDFVRCSERAGLKVLEASATLGSALTEAEVQAFAPEFRDNYSFNELAELDLFLAAVKP